MKAMPVCVRVACAEEFLLQLPSPAAELEEGRQPRPHRQTLAQPEAWQWSLAGLFFPAPLFHLPAGVKQHPKPDCFFPLPSICIGKIQAPKISLKTHKEEVRGKCLFSSSAKMIQKRLP